MCTEIDKHCEIGHNRLLMSSIETEKQLSYCGSTVNNVKTCVINMIIQNLYFGFCQTFQKNKEHVQSRSGVQKSRVFRE